MRFDHWQLLELPQFVEEKPNRVQRAADRDGRDGVGRQDGQGRHQKRGRVDPPHPVQPAPGAPLEEAEAHVRGHAGQGGQGDAGDQAEPTPTRMSRKTACRRFERRVVPPQRIFARLRAGMPTLIGSAENAGTEVGDAVSTQLADRRRPACRRSMTPPKVLDDARCDQDIDRRSRRPAPRRQAINL